MALSVVFALKPLPPTAQCHRQPISGIGRRPFSTNRTASVGLSREHRSEAPRRCHLQPSGDPREACLFRPTTP
jgi:hypothetical protein